MIRLKPCLAVLLLAATAASADIRPLALPANDLVYDSVSHKIYASVPSSAGASGNSITAIDPETGAIGPSVFIGSGPNRLALSDDGQYLYEGLDGAAAVRRFDLISQTAGPQFSLGADAFLGLYYVDDMAVQPGHPDVVAVSRKYRDIGPRHAGVAIYDHGVARPHVTPPHTGSNVIAFSRSPSRLYGYDNESTEYGFRRMTVDAAGVTVDDVTDDLITGYNLEIRYDQGLLFSTGGQEIDPEAGTLLGSFYGIGDRAPVAPDVKAGRVYFLAGDGSTRQLLSFDPQTFLQVGAMDVPGVMGQAHSLIRWGQERSDGGGLAFATDQGQVFLLPLIPPSPPPAPPVLASLTLTPNSFAGAGTITVTVTLTAPAPAGGFPVVLYSNNPAAARLPPVLTAPAGALTASTPVSVSPVSAPVDVVISATVTDVTQTATLHLTPPSPPPPDFSLALGQVTFAGLVDAGGLNLPLTSSNTSGAIVPADPFVPSGAATVTFPIPA